MKNCSTNAKEKPNVKQVTVTACDIANVVAKLLNKSKSESQEPDPQAKLARQVPIEGESPDGLGSFGWFGVVWVACQMGGWVVAVGDDCY